jgi:hypothetical protein
LKSYQGKVINARIEKAFNLQGYKASYGKYYDSPQLHIRRESRDECGEIQYNEYYIVYIGAKKQERFDVAFLKNKAKELKEHAASDRQKAANICEIVNKYNSALQWFKGAKDELHCIPHFYDWSKY